MYSSSTQNSARQMVVSSNPINFIMTSAAGRRQHNTELGAHQKNLPLARSRYGEGASPAKL